MTVAIIVCDVVLVILGAGALVAHFAPYGWEDKDGYHSGRKGKP